MVAYTYPDGHYMGIDCVAFKTEEERTRWLEMSGYEESEDVNFELVEQEI